MNNLGRLSGRERYRLLVSLLIIPLGFIIVFRAVIVGAQAWMLIALGLAFVGLGMERLKHMRKINASSELKEGET